MILLKLLSIWDKDSEFTANGHILDEFCNDEEVDNEDLIKDESAMNAVFVYKLMQ